MDTDEIDTSSTKIIYDGLLDHQVTGKPIDALNDYRLDAVFVLLKAYHHLGQSRPGLQGPTDPLIPEDPIDCDAVAYCRMASSCRTRPSPSTCPLPLTRRYPYACIGSLSFLSYRFVKERGYEVLMREVATVSVETVTERVKFYRFMLAF